MAKNIWRIQTKKNVSKIKDNIKKSGYKLVEQEKEGGYNYLYFNTKGEKPSSDFYIQNKKLSGGSDVYLLRTSRQESQDAQELNKNFGGTE